MRRPVLVIARAAALFAVIVGFALILAPAEPRTLLFYGGAAVAALMLVAIAGPGPSKRNEARIAELERTLESERAARVQAEAHARDLQHDLEKTRTARERAERHAGKAGARIEDFEKKLEEANKKIEDLSRRPK